MPIHRRRAMTLVALWPVATACDAQDTGPPLSDKQKMFGDVGMELVADAVPGTEMLGVEFYADGGDRPFYAKSALRVNNRSSLSYGNKRVPQVVRVVWRKTDKWAYIGWSSAGGYDEKGQPIQNYLRADGKPFDPSEEVAKRKAVYAARGWIHHGPWGSDYGDEVLGDYTLPIADRIPAAVAESLRKDRKGSLRLKFRLHPDGALFGWDIERRPGWKPGLSVAPVYEHVGGDFQEAPLLYDADGKVSRGKGWYIHPKTKARIETDF